LSDTQIRVWKTVREAQRAAFESVKVGISGKVVDDAARDVVRRKGEREVERTGFTHRLGESSAAIPASCGD
jgi:Xaa-Pro aminopeptidase